MRIIFTRSERLFSKAIRKVTGEDVSHCALEIGDYIVQSNLYGPNVVAKADFDSEIVYAVDWPENDQHVLKLLAEGHFFGYDWGAFFYLGLATLFPSLPRKNLWKTTGMYLCTEFVTEYVDGTADAMITPHGLYARLERAKS